jgi:SOS-response transcriptional repressor LexA
MNKLAEIRDALGFKTTSEFARFMDKHPATLDKYLKNDRNIGTKFIQDLKSKIPNLNEKYFFSSSEPMFNTPVKNTHSESKHLSSVPILGFADCGLPTAQWLDVAERHIDLPDVKQYKTPFVLIAKGESMKPYILPGDKLVCADAPDLIKDKSAVVAGFNTLPDLYEANAKLIMRDKKNKVITLYSINTKFPPVNYKEEDINKIYKLVKIIRDVK